MKTVGFLGVVLALIVSQPALAQNITASAESVGTALEDAGVDYEVIREGTRVVVRARTGGTMYGIFLSDCDSDGANCSSAQFYTGVELDAPISAQDANAYTRDMRWGRVYAEPDAVSMEMDVNLAGGGMPPALFADYLDLWAMMVAAFMLWTQTGEIPGG